LSTYADVKQQAPRHRLGTSWSRDGMLGLGEWLLVGSVTGLFAGLAMAAPLVIWGWARQAHIALELPTATTAWLFGLGHFSHDTYSFWPIVVGTGFLAVYWIVSGLAFTGLADRLYHLRTLGKSLLAGAAWSIVNFLFFWYMLLPIARDGAPFRATPSKPGLFVAPNWVWILAFTVFGLACGLFYAVLRPAGAVEEAEGNGRR
jgi:hypothetical protein